MSSGRLGSTYLQWCREIPEMAAMSDEQHSACRYLESRGLQFAIHFGWANCVRIAQSMFLNEAAYRA